MHVPEHKTREIQDLIITNGVKETMDGFLNKLDKGIPSVNTVQYPVAYPCGICGRNCANNPNKKSEQSYGCDACQKWFHYNCLRLTGSEHFVRKRRCMWKCADCRASTSRKQRKNYLQ